MTQKTENKIKWMKSISIPTLLATIAVGIFNTGGQVTSIKKDLKDLTFPDVDTKVEVLKHVKDSPSDVDIYKQYLYLKNLRENDSINKTFIVSYIKASDKRDSLRAVTDWQMKQAVEKINDKLNIEN